jgi:hypothetical protein
MFIARVVFYRRQPDTGDWRPRPGYHLQVDAGGVFTSSAIESLGDEPVFEFEQEYTVRLRNSRASWQPETMYPSDSYLN